MGRFTGPPTPINTQKSIVTVSHCLRPTYHTSLGSAESAPACYPLKLLQGWFPHCTPNENPHLPPASFSTTSSAPPLPMTPPALQCPPPHPPPPSCCEVECHPAAPKHHACSKLALLSSPHTPLPASKGTSQGSPPPKKFPTPPPHLAAVRLSATPPALRLIRNTITSRG